MLRKQAPPAAASEEAPAAAPAPSEAEAPALARTKGGKFASGNKGGPGRPRGPRMIDRVVGPEEELAMWERELFLAMVCDDRDARRFILSTRLGRARAPALSALDLGDISTLEGVQRGLRLLFAAQAAGSISPDEFDYRLQSLERTAKVLESVDVLPMLRELAQRVEAMER